jgi:hypothetical protein
VLATTQNAAGTEQVPLYMGTAVPLLAVTQEGYRIALPEQGSQGRLLYRIATIPGTADVRQGFLPYTRRNVLVQAFKLLHTPYSWGGKGEFRDCSQFIMDVYATMGLTLPRNSSMQAIVGKSRKSFWRGDSEVARKKALNKISGPAIVQFPGHVMLYLGVFNQRHYCIHDVWAYRVREPNLPGVEDRKVIIGKVVVSDMSLGEQSSKGSFLKRMAVVNTLTY